MWVVEVRFIDGATITRGFAEKPLLFRTRDGDFKIVSNGEDMIIFVRSTVNFISLEKREDSSG